MESLTTMPRTLEIRKVSIPFRFSYGHAKAMHRGVSAILCTARREDALEGYGEGVTYANYQSHVESVLNACQPGGRLGGLGNVDCLEAQPLFEGMGADFVVLERTQAQLLDLLWAPIAADVRPLFDVYWSQNPAGLVYGDGVHLSAAGKDAYAEGIVAALLSVYPDL